MLNNLLMQMTLTHELKLLQKDIQYMLFSCINKCQSCSFLVWFGLVWFGSTRV
jgi:hypothetical protein